MNRTDTETRRASRSDEVTFLSPRLIDAGSVPRADVERLVAAWRKSGNASFIDYLIEVRFLNAFGARVIRAAQEGSSDVSLDDILRKLKSVGKLQMPATLAPAAAPAAPVMAPAAAFIEREAPRVGTKMGRFMLDEALGEGATSITYRAFHPALGVPVAVKVFKRGSNMPGVVDQFVREARLLARIDHPAIVRVIDVDHDGGTPYIVFEYVGAMTLEEAVGAFGGLDARRVARIGARLAAGLGAAHKLGVLHRDIKPANILVRKDGQPRLADFGLALLGDHDREARGQIVGTPAYMAPEVVVQSGTIDHRADMYSLGATLWHAAVGHPPFPRGDVTQMLLAHVNDEPQEICEVDPYFDEELSDVIMRLLSKRPDERYRDWESVHDALSSTNVHQGKSSSRVWSIGGSSFLGASIAVGMVVGEQYRTEAFIDSDSSSMTYRSTDLNSNRPVFLRMLRTEVLNREEGVLSQVEQDVLKASRLRHPNVLHTEPVKQIGGLPVLVMECFDGSEPLSRRMRSASQPVSLPAAVSIIQQLAAALNAGHQEGLVHSGIQPQSVLVDAENRVKLSGFGLARLGGHYRTTSGGVVLGSLDYISPEQCRGQAPDHRSDVYSFGCVAYELLAGRPPFHSESVLAALQAHVEKEPKPLREIEARVPESLAQVIMRCLAKDAADRYHTMAEVARSLERTSNGTRLITRDSMNELVGAVIGERYRVDDLIGHGAMGAVYRAFDLKLEENVALKVLKAEFLNANPNAVSRFKQEIRIARRISHPNVVRVHDFVEIDGLALLSMECFEGRDLRSLIDQRGRLTWEDAVRAMIPVARGLAAAHELGIVHRDVKPHNVLIDDDGRVKLLDFGIASLTGQHVKGMTIEERIVGTPDYISPEQCTCEKVDHRCDVYSFGCTLFEAVTGCVPYTGDSLMNVLIAHIQKPAPRVRSLVDSAPLELDELVAQCMAKAPDQRYQSMDEVLIALGDMVGEPHGGGAASSSGGSWAIAGVS